MKNLIVASAVTLLLGTAAAQADSYVSVLGGPTFAPDLNVNGSKNGMDTGFNVGVRYGYYLDDLINIPNLSVEADWLLTQSDYSNVPNARLQSSSYMADLVYHLPLDGPLHLSGFQLYGGAGLGAVNTNIDRTLNVNMLIFGLIWSALI